MTTKTPKAAARNERRTKRNRVNKDEGLHRLLDQHPGNHVKVKDVVVQPLNLAQRTYDNAIQTADIVFGVGPAGTGKTWFAAMRAAQAFKNGDIERIVITRPAVEAGESLGFLPGELDEKFEPYFRPVREALEEALGSGRLDYMIRAGQIQARPLALLRGSTLKNCWLIADEMQNASKVQFKMLLSRIGDNAKFIVNGDPDQADINNSGLEDAMNRLRDKPGIRTVLFDRGDIVRSGLCQIVVDAYSN